MKKLVSKLKDLEKNETKEELLEKLKIFDKALSARMQQDVDKLVKKNPKLLDTAKQIILDENTELKKLAPEKIEELAKQKLAEKRKEILIKKAQQQILDENPELKKLSSEKLNTLAENKIVENRKKQLDKKQENGKTIYENIVVENKNIKKLDNINPKLTKELIAVYGKELTSAYAKLLKNIPKDKFLKNIEEFDKFVKEKFAKTYEKEIQGDNKTDQEDGSDSKPISREHIHHYVHRNIYNPRSVESMAACANNEYKSLGNSFEAGNFKKEDFEKLLQNLPDGKLKKALDNVKSLIGLNEHDKRVKNYLNEHGQNIDPAKTPWCRAFVNAFLDDMGIKTNGSLSARDGAKSIGKEINSKDLVPGDIVVCERKGKATDGSPGGHIGIFLGMSKDGHPIILNGNSRNMIRIKEEKRNIIAFRQAMSDEDHRKIKESLEKKS